MQQALFLPLTLCVLVMAYMAEVWIEGENSAPITNFTFIVSPLYPEHARASCRAHSRTLEVTFASLLPEEGWSCESSGNEETAFAYAMGLLMLIGVVQVCLQHPCLPSLVPQVPHQTSAMHNVRVRYRGSSAKEQKTASLLYRPP